ncbi:hypothetical protein NliqN6_0159 [Naganishia liquefaciens]|uniref:Uncharacterized protein n=1 Tax=Naganishia liquefaciens TaxID=104408 RepID=A0A8H3YCZ0_9TREE|nr:hypothetical protein NliqN6_0159 [Naganishia liquefaciens]
MATGSLFGPDGKVVPKGPRKQQVNQRIDQESVGTRIPPARNHLQSSTRSSVAAQPSIDNNLRALTQLSAAAELTQTAENTSPSFRVSSTSRRISLPPQRQVYQAWALEKSLRNKPRPKVPEHSPRGPSEVTADDQIELPPAESEAYVPDTESHTARDRSLESAVSSGDIQGKTNNQDALEDGAAGMRMDDVGKTSSGMAEESEDQGEEAPSVTMIAETFEATESLEAAVGDPAPLTQDSSATSSQPASSSASWRSSHRNRPLPLGNRRQRPRPRLRVESHNSAPASPPSTPIALNIAVNATRGRRQTANRRQPRG